MPCCGKRAAPPSTRENPTRIGDPTDDVVKARVTVTMSGYRAGQIGWFTGTSIPALIAGSQLVPV